MKPQDELLERLRLLQEKIDFVKPKIDRDELKDTLSRFTQLLGELAKINQAKRHELEKTESEEEVPELDPVTANLADVMGKYMLSPKEYPRNPGELRDTWVPLILMAASDVEDAVETGLQVGHLLGMIMGDDLRRAKRSEDNKTVSDLQIVETLKLNKGNVSQAAKHLKLSRSTIEGRVKKIAKNFNVTREIVLGRPVRD